MQEYLTYQNILYTNYILFGLLFVFNIYQVAKLVTLIIQRISKKGKANKRKNIEVGFFSKSKYRIGYFFGYRGFLRRSLFLMEKKVPKSNSTKVSIVQRKKLDWHFLLKWGFFLVFLNVVLISCCLFSIVAFLRSNVEIEKGNLKDEIWQDLREPLVFRFENPIDYKEVDFKFSEDVEGEWDFEKISIGNKTMLEKVTFISEQTLFPGEEYELEINNIQNYFSKDKHGKLFKIKSPAANEIVEQNITDDEQGVALDKVLEFTMKENPDVYETWDFELDKEVEMEKEVEGEKLKVSFKEKLAVDEEYNLTIYRTLQSIDSKSGEVIETREKEMLHAIAFHTIGKPRVIWKYPEYTVLPDDEIKVQFDQEMVRAETEALFKIEPEMPGSFSWEQEGKMLVFKPDNQFEKEKKYKIGLDKGLKGVKGPVSEEPFSHSFYGIGKVKVVAWQPEKDAKLVETDMEIKVTFDQEVKHESAEGNFKIEPEVEGEKRWEGNTFIFKPNENLKKDQTYKITFLKGIESVHGENSEDDYSINFSTRSNKFVLDVPQHHQGKRYTCNVTAARMVLDYKGVKKGEMEIYNALPKDNTPCDPVKGVWGNPHQGYVGNVSGNKSGGCISSDGKSGYGVYWEPIHAYIEKQGVVAKIKRNWTITGLTEELSKGNPAILWWQNGAWPAYDRSWRTPEGEKIKAINGMHSEVAIGYKGDKDNPTHIIVRDPWRGYRELSIDYVEDKWKHFDQTAVVVY